MSPGTAAPAEITLPAPARSDSVIDLPEKPPPAAPAESPGAGMEAASLSRGTFLPSVTKTKQNALTPFKKSLLWADSAPARRAHGAALQGWAEEPEKNKIQLRDVHTSVPWR